MRNIILTLFLIPLFLVASQAQVLMKGKIENLPVSAKAKISVEQWNDDHWVEVDTFSLSTEKTFQKNVKVNQGHFRIKMWGQPSSWVDFVVSSSNPSSSILDFGNLDFKQMQGVPAKLSGAENEAYNSLQTAFKKYQSLRDSLQKAENNPAINKTEILNKINLAREALNEQCRILASKNKGSFVGDVLTQILYIPVKSDYAFDAEIGKMSDEAFDKVHRIDRLPLGDKRAILHLNLTKVLNNYWLQFTRTDSLQMQFYIDKVMSKRRGNDEVDSWLFRFMLSKFVGQKDDASLSYLLKWYAPGCSIDEINADNTTKTLLLALSNCEVGKKAFNLTLPDSSGKMNSIAEIASKSKLTLLFLWRSDCSHCHEFEPKLQELYNKYKASGLQVIGILMDWNEKYKAKSFPTWVRLNAATQEQKRMISRNFPIPGTPAIIAVDKNLIVKNRMVIRATIDKYLEEEFKKK